MPPFAAGTVLLILFSLAAGAAQAPSQSADEARQRLEQAERDRAAALTTQQSAASLAAAQAVEAARLAGQRAAAVARLRQAEQQAAEAASHMQALTAARRGADERLATDARKLAPLLPVIERLSLFPAETVLAVPLPPDSAVRGLLVVRSIAREVAHEAASLRREQADLAAASAELAAAAPAMEAAQAAQVAAAAELDRQFATANDSRRAAEDESAAAGHRAEALAEQAASLRALLDQLAQAQKDQAQKDQAQKAEARNARKVRRRDVAFVPARPGPVASGGPRGPLLLPVAGSVTRGWGVPTEAGPTVGISYRAAPAARVVAPCGGTVMFAAPFRSYGNLLIIDCGGGFTAVLAGFGHLDVSPNKTVVRGVPVGSLPGDSSGTGANLYVELRRNGEPVDPGPWFKAGR